MEGDDFVDDDGVDGDDDDDVVVVVGCELLLNLAFFLKAVSSNNSTVTNVSNGKNTLPTHILKPLLASALPLETALLLLALFLVFMLK